MTDWAKLIKPTSFTIESDVELPSLKDINVSWNNPAVFNSRISSMQELDDFPTPPWATRALAGTLIASGLMDPSGVALEPACGRGHMHRALTEYFRHVGCFDIADYGCGYDVRDFLSAAPFKYDWLITNPPFKAAQDFALRGLAEAKQGVALFVRTNFLEGQTRFKELYNVHKPTLILQFTERVVLHEHELRDPDKLYQLPDGTWKKPSTATSYCWIVWLVKNKPRQSNFDWIAPCRASLTKPWDYVVLPGS